MIHLDETTTCRLYAPQAGAIYQGDEQHPPAAAIRFGSRRQLWFDDPEELRQLIAVAAVQAQNLDRAIAERRAEVERKADAEQRAEAEHAAAMQLLLGAAPDAGQQPDGSGPATVDGTPQLEPALTRARPYVQPAPGIPAPSVPPGTPAQVGTVTVAGIGASAVTGIGVGEVAPGPTSAAHSS